MPTDAIGLTIAAYYVPTLYLGFAQGIYGVGEYIEGGSPTASRADSAIPVYEHPDGLETFATDNPYILSDGVSLLAPIPVFDAGGAVWIDAEGNAHDALAVTVVPEV